MIFKISRYTPTVYKDIGYISLCKHSIADIVLVLEAIKSARIQIESIPSQDLMLVPNIHGYTSIMRVKSKQLLFKIAPLLQNKITWSPITSFTINTVNPCLFIDPIPQPQPVQNAADRFYDEQFDELREQLIREVRARQQRNE